MSSHNPLLERYRALLERRRAHSTLRRLTIAQPDSVDFSTNDFLSLSKSPALRRGFIEEFTNASRAVAIGSGGSRLLDGNCVYVEELERNIADFHNAPAGILFNSGFDANSGLFSCVPLLGDVVMYDEYIHASVHEGMKLSRAGLHLSFPHNSVRDFKLALQKQIAVDPMVRSGRRNVFVAVESVYSMDGDVAPIREILDTIDLLLPLGNGHLIVDEAHATGVFERSGRGIVCDLGVEHRVFARLHTFGKALSSGGAIILCSPTLREYLINYARSLIYTTALGLPTLAMIKSVYTLLQNGGVQQAQQTLRHLITHLHTRLQSLPPTPLLHIPESTPRSPIFSLCTPQPRSLANYCQARGFVVRPIMPPTIPEGGERVRVCLHAANTTEEVDRLVDAVAEWVRTVDGGAGAGAGAGAGESEAVVSAVGEERARL